MIEVLVQQELCEYLKQIARTPAREMKSADLVLHLQETSIRYSTLENKAAKDVALDRMNEIREELLTRIR